MFQKCELFKFLYLFIDFDLLFRIILSPESIKDMTSEFTLFGFHHLISIASI